MKDSAPVPSAIPVSVCILARNEEEKLSSCLASLQGFSEVILMDTGSTDKTVSLAEEWGAKVIAGSWEGFGATRKALFTTASESWILWLDADEILPPDLREEIINCARSDTKLEGFEINRLNHVGKKRLRHGDWAPDWRLRFFRKTAWKMEEKDVYESVLIDGNVGRFMTPLLHYGYEDWKERSEHVQRFARLWAAELFHLGKRVTVFDQVSSAIAIFFRGYFFRLGFLDGIAGIRAAISSAAKSYYGYRNLRNSWARFGGGG